jgi:hypothetical protein
MDAMDYLFQFEQDKYYALRRVPMVMRIKLDLCGVKLSIRDWSKFSREDRESLAAMPYESEMQLAAFRMRVQELIVTINGDSTEADPCFRPAPWEIQDEMPAQIGCQMRALGMPVLTLAQWAALSVLQRYALTKLTREGAKNEKLPAALKEFGLVRENLEAPR